jgi:hypothetical protein
MPARWLDQERQVHVPQIRTGLAAVLFLVIYVPAAIQVARLRPLWEDEMFTLALGRIRSPHELWSALLTGADQHPFLFYRLSGLLLDVLSPPELALRWPSVVAGIVLALAVFVYLTPRTSAVYGLIGMLLVSSTAAWTYASQARGYELMTAAIAVAFVAWQAVERHRGASLALGAATLLAVCSHYYAVLALLPIAVGETALMVNARRVRLSVWLALASAGLPLFLSVPLLRAAHGYAPAFWGKPSPGSIADTYTFLFQPPFVPVFVCVVVGCGAILSRGKIRMAPGVSGVPPHEVAALGALLALPIIAVVASLVIGAYAPRYTLPTVIGGAILLTLAVNRACQGQTAAGLLVVLPLAMWFLLTAYRSEAIAARSMTRLHETAAWLARTEGDLPLVGYHPQAFLVMAAYGPPELQRRVYFLADSSQALRYLGQNTADRGLPALRTWFPPGIASYRTFIAEHPRFLLYGWPMPGARNWILPTLRDAGAKLTLVGRSLSVELYVVEVDPTKTAAPGDRGQHRSGSP